MFSTRSGRRAATITASLATTAVLVVGCADSHNPAVKAEGHFLDSTTYRCAEGYSQIDLPTGDVEQVDGSRYSLGANGELKVKLAKHTSLPAAIVPANTYAGSYRVISLNLEKGASATYTLQDFPDQVTLCVNTVKPPSKKTS